MGIRAAAGGRPHILIDIKYASICYSDIYEMKGYWGPQQYPQVPGHETVGIVTAVGKDVTKFKVGDRAGVGCMVDGNRECESFTQGEEQYCPDTTFTYGYPEASSPTGISQRRLLDQYLRKGALRRPHPGPRKAATDPGSVKTAHHERQ